MVDESGENHSKLIVNDFFASFFVFPDINFKAPIFINKFLNIFRPINANPINNIFQ